VANPAPHRLAACTSVSSLTMKTISYPVARI
jgi:hypothetical protein